MHRPVGILHRATKASVSLMTQPLNILVSVSHETGSRDLSGEINRVNLNLIGEHQTSQEGTVTYISFELMFLHLLR